MMRLILKTVMVGLLLHLHTFAPHGHVCGQTVAEPPPRRKQPANTAQIKRLIRQLGSEDFRAREKASKALEAIGEPALPALRKARKSVDLEIRRRVAALLKSLTRKRSAARAKAWAEIEKAHGVVGLEDKKDPDSLIRVIGLGGPWPAGDSAAAWLPWLDDAKHLSFMDTQISDDGLVNIETFYRVEGLTLTRNKVITDKGLQHVGKLTTLRVLGLDETQVTDAGLPHLRNLKQLGFLDLMGTKITDAGLKYIKNFKNLESLDLALTQVTDKGMDNLKEIKTLECLNLRRTKVGDTGLAKLKHLKNLLWLNLSETQITDAGLVHLKGLKKLDWLNVNKSKVTKRGRAELQKSLPKLNIVDP